MASYVYGPVPSRRLGQSLGVSPIPEKTCNYSCIYCQLGKTTNFTNHRKRFYNPKNIINEISEALKQEGEIDYITFVGEGEPTLSKDLGFLIESTKELTSLPIAVITNGSLFSSKVIREEVRKVDLIIPTFDAGNSKLFRYINRPHKEIRFNNLVTGLKKLRQEFNNEIWIEVMLLKGINDSNDLLEEIKGFLDKFQPDQIQINIPSRPPTESWVEIPDNKALNLGKLILQSTQILPLNEVGIFDPGLFKTPIEAIFSITKRHPLRYNQALEIIHQFNIENPEAYLNMLISKQMLRILEYRDSRFIYRDKENKSEFSKKA
ncbi:MAG: radical SAM protein [Promethearchaeota archaeon]